ncbi:MAG: ribosome biogenesis GTPase YlqF [Candidatus Eremiobacteraeota bacterium]|nr:ribosome biogenesis GTPase YlqF [Candidatus Eremiobacteraeota bacterium]
MSKTWFPGHMQKAVRLLKENASYLDLLVIILDARIPFTSRNIILEKTFHRPKKIFVLNKSDLANPNITTSWVRYLKMSGIRVVQASAGRIRSLEKLIFSISGKGNSASIFKIMIAGIPNVGKSSIINRLAHGSKAKVSDLPGTTRGKQWIQLGNGIALLDSPGVIPPAMKSQTARWKLAACGCIAMRGNLPHEASVSLLEYMRRYHEPGMPEIPENFETFAIEMNFIKPGGEPDRDRAELFFLKRFAEGKFGRYSLEIPGNIK